MTFRNQFDTELDNLKLELIKMGDAVIDNIKYGLRSFLTKDIPLAETIIKKDKDINAFEQVIEKDCLRLILKEQPVARDLRLITAILKMITDLERIGDHAADISKMTIYMERTKHDFASEKIVKMTEVCQMMIRQALDSFINNDLVLAEKVIVTDDIVDELFDQVRGDIGQAIRLTTIDPDYALFFMMVAKYLERIGDHAVNLGEWVIFSVTGEHKHNLIF